MGFGETRPDPDACVVWRVGLRLRAQDPRDVTLFPGDGALVVPELLFSLAKLRRMNERAARPSARGNHVMEHLVVDDELNEVAGDPRPIEVRVDADQATDRAVAPELDGRARLVRG